MINRNYVPGFMTSILLLLRRTLVLLINQSTVDGFSERTRVQRNRR